MRCLLVIGIITLYMTMYSNGTPTPDSSVTSLSERKIEQSEQLVVNLVRNFSSDYFQKITGNGLNPRVNSPLNTFIPASLLSYGARGQTRKDYLSAIGLPEDKTEMVKQGYQNFLGKLNKYDVQIKTKLFVQSNMTLDSYFSKVSTEVFNAEIEPIEVDEGFIDGEIISDWIYDQTNSKISKGFLPQSMGCDMSVVFVNTINCEGTWKVGFNRSRTVPSYFTVPNGRVKVQTMSTVGRFRSGWIEELEARFIELPYKSDSENEAMSVFIVMPDLYNYDAWKSMIPKLRNVDLTRFLNGTEEEMEIHLPKFRWVNTDGLDDPFDWDPRPVFPYNKTDVSGIFKSPKLSIPSNSLTQSVIEADEDGLHVAQLSLIAFSTRPCGICDDYTLRLSACHQIAMAKEEQCQGNGFTYLNRNTRSTVKEFKVDRPFVGFVMTKGQIFTDIFSINFSGMQFRSGDVDRW